MELQYLLWMLSSLLRLKFLGTANGGSFFKRKKWKNLLMNKRILFYRKDLQYQELKTFLRNYQGVFFLSEEHDLLAVDFKKPFQKQDLLKLREFFLQEFIMDFVGLYLPDNFEIEGLLADNFLNELNFGVYSISDLITNICLNKRISLKNGLKDYYYTLIGIENINTAIGFIENNFNATLASKKLFLHRNTLNYRLDNFVEKSGINIRSFKEGLAIYLLFRS